jgi:hypothetical protein
VGKFGFMARLTDQSTSPALSDLTIKVQELTNGNVLQNADAAPGDIDRSGGRAVRRWCLEPR